MITLNQKTRLPWSARYYGLAWLFIILLLITFVSSLGGHGVEMFVFVGRFMILIALWLLVEYSCVSYVISENTITMNSGVLIKRSKY